MFFVFVMECFSALITTTEERGLFLPLGAPAIKHQISLYADNVVIFVLPVEHKLLLIKAVFDLFFKDMGLAANCTKSQAFPIRCETPHMDLISELLGYTVGSLPCTYLGIPLSPGRLPRAAMQPLVDKVANQIPAWKGRLLNRSGRLVLVQSTLCAIPVHISMALKAAPRAVKTITTIIRGFLRCGTEVASAGKCAVA
jgi:hypothetical protein